MGKDSYLYLGFGQDAVSVWATQDEFSSSCSFFSGKWADLGGMGNECDRGTLSEIHN